MNRQFIVFLFDRLQANHSADSLQPKIRDQHDYLDKPSYDLRALLAEPMQQCLFELHQQLTNFGFDLLQIDHEDAPGQYEVNYEFDHALNAADQWMRFKLAAHSIAEKHGFLFSLMPKPFADRPGSGLHFHLSLEGSSDTQLAHSVAGLLAHAPALACIHAPTVNSYKRLVSHGSASGTTWAPTHICHGENNRSAIARTLPGRVEWRIPDPTTNVYLALAAVIYAMLDGLENQLPLPAQINDDISEWSEQQIATANIRQLPASLLAATEALEGDRVISKGLGAELCGRFVQERRQEWAMFSRQIHSWEIAQYLNRA